MALVQRTDLGRKRIGRLTALTGLVGCALASVLLAAPAGALTVTGAALGAGTGCADIGCTDQRLTLSSGTSGGGTLTLNTGVSVTFSVTIPSSTFLPIGGPDDNSVTQLDFTNVTYSGTATIFSNAGLHVITGGSGAVSGTQTPTGAGVAGPFAVVDSLLSGSCLDIVGGVSCGIIFSPLNDFDFDVNGQGRYFSHTVNLTAVPEPGTAALLGMALAGLGFAARRRA